MKVQFYFINGSEGPCIEICIRDTFSGFYLELNNYRECLLNLIVNIYNEDFEIGYLKDKDYYNFSIDQKYTLQETNNHHGYLTTSELILISTIDASDIFDVEAELSRLYYSLPNTHPELFL